MSDDKPDLSSRYYVAEATIWILGGVLLIARFLGLAPSQSLPILNIALENSQLFIRVVSLLQVFTTLYLFLEWNQSSTPSRRSYWAQARAGFTTVFSCVSLWLSYSLIVKNTSFTGISPAWYFMFIVTGLLIGGCISTLAFASLMIKTPMEAKVIKLSRVPVASLAQFVGWIPIAIILMLIYYLLWHFTPHVLKIIGPCLAVSAYLSMFMPDIVSLFFYRDEDGNHIPYRKRITQLKTIFDFHDYSYFLHDHGRKESQKIEISTDADPQVIQKMMQEKFSETQDNKKETFRVSRISDNHYDKQDFEIPISLVQKYMEEYVKKYPDQAKKAPEKIFQYAVEQAIENMDCQQERPLLHRAVEAGQEQAVRELLQQNLDVNEQAEAGWTALLYAAAQGYPKIARLLLDNGANPDIGNTLGITPLMYGARYKNVDICKLLIEYGANLDLQDIYGTTALIWATLMGSNDVARLLLEAGVKTNIKDRHGMTALDFAHKNKQGKIARMIRTAKSTK